MATSVEVEKLALDLPEAQRAILAARLLRSLPAILQEHDDGVAEALSRDSDFEPILRSVSPKKSWTIGLGVAAADADRLPSEGLL